MSNPLVDMEKPDVIFCIGTNMTEAHPVAATRLKKAMAKGAKLIVADPRRIGLADISHLYLPIRVGSDTALLLGMAHVIAKEGLTVADLVRDSVTATLTDAGIEPSQVESIHVGNGPGAMALAVMCLSARCEANVRVR